MTKIPELTPIESSMFSGHHYDPTTREMTVQFKNGAIHVYDDVPMEKHEAFTGSASPGKYFNDRIKQMYPLRSSALEIRIVRLFDTKETKYRALVRCSFLLEGGDWHLPDRSHENE